jgi:enoyl-CoA hydratase
MNFETLLYEIDGRIATITLNRPERLDTIVPPMPEEIESEGVLAAITRRDGPFADYSQAPPERKPRPSNVIDPTRGPATKA